MMILDDVWWVRKEDFPPDDLPILAPYERTRSGFELIAAEMLKNSPDSAEFPVDEDGYQRICLWNVFEKEKDPAITDEEKQRINEMQQALEKVSDNDRYIRVQIACYDRCYWTFPRNVDLIINGIAEERPNLSMCVGCEPPWNHGILPLLRKRRGHSLHPNFYAHHTDDPFREEQIFLSAYLLNSSYA
jgi:hypothetical protein